MKKVKLLVKYSDGASFITKFNGNVREAVKSYKELNAKCMDSNAKVVSISVLGRSVPVVVSMEG